MTGLWNAQWGDDYHRRNPATEVEIAKRMQLWRKIFAAMNEMPRSFLDVGAGAGANGKAIDTLYKQKPDIRALDVKPREPGVIEASATRIPLPDGTADMVYTYGVLIHLNDRELLNAMEEIYRCSRRWIFCAEYFNPTPIEVPYRGQRDVLWKRDYGSLWLDTFDLQLVAYGFEWKRTSGLDNITWWLLRKSF